MVLILDNNSENLEHVGKKQVMFENDFKFSTVVDFNKCLVQIKLPISGVHLIIDCRLI